MRVGLKLCSEERTATELVADAVLAEQAGFEFAAISDHFHPWIDAQGQSPFVWSVLGAIATSTDRLEVGTAVTCPTVRTHPVVIAQAAATVSTMMPGRFFLGVGTGERLNEHVTGERWPPPDARRSMLREAVGLMRELWTGEQVTHRGEHYVVEGAKLYSLPDEMPSVLVAASGESAASMAADIGDGLIGLAPDEELVTAYRRDADAGARAYAEITVCWSDDADDGTQTALRLWPNAGLPGAMSAELALPAHFEAAAELVSAGDLRTIVTGPDPKPYVDMAGTYADAGYDGVWFHQVGTDQEGFAGFAERELLPEISGLSGSR